MAPNDGPEEGPFTEIRKDDATWLVRQFGRYAHYLKGDSTYEGGLPQFPADSGSLIAAKTLPTDGHTQARRLLQLSNRQHEEYLQNMHQLYAAHAQRMRQRYRTKMHNVNTVSIVQRTDPSPSGCSA